MTVVFDASATLAGTDDGNGNGNFNARQLFTPAALSAASGNQIRLTLLFGTAEGSETAAIDAVWVGQRTTTTIVSPPTSSIFTGNQVQVLFGGSGSVNGSAAGVVVSDWITLGENWDNTKGYMVAWHGATGKTSNVSIGTVSNTAQAFYSGTVGGSTASQTTASPNMDLLNATTAALISKIEIQAAAGGGGIANKLIVRKQSIVRASSW